MYAALVDELKLLLKKEHLTCIDDETIQTLVHGIEIERHRIAKSLDTKLKDLQCLNDLLILFGEEPQTTISKAHKLFKKKVFINLYDLELGDYDKRTTKNRLRRELRKNPYRRFPLKYTKENPVLKSFLTFL